MSINGYFEFLNLFKRFFLSINPQTSTPTKIWAFVELSSVGQFADGVAVKKIGKNTFDIGKKYIDKMITVNTDEICAAIKDVFEDTRSILEQQAHYQQQE